MGTQTYNSNSKAVSVFVSWTLCSLTMCFESAHSISTAISWPMSFAQHCHSQSHKDIREIPKRRSCIRLNVRANPSPMIEPVCVPSPMLGYCFVLLSTGELLVVLSSTEKPGFRALRLRNLEPPLDRYPTDVDCITGDGKQHIFA